MKTTVEISDTLFNEVRRLAAAERTTLRALIEEGLTQVVQRRSDPKPFKMRDASFKGGKGLQPEFTDADWSKIRDAIYEGHGA
jgi:hypothetical protein